MRSVSRIEGDAWFKNLLRGTDEADGDDVGGNNVVGLC